MNLSHYVLGIRKIHGWITMTEEHFGKDFADKCEQYDQALIDGEALAKKFYYETELPKVSESLKEFRKEMEPFGKECKARRRKELETLVEQGKQKLVELMQHRGDIEKKQKLIEGIKKIERRLESDISPDEIERAREYPIENLIPIRNGMSKCVEHDDKSPSMNCKKNFVYCHSCGFHADAIGLYMKLNNCGFKEAVKTLS